MGWSGTDNGELLRIASDAGFKAIVAEAVLSRLGLKPTEYIRMAVSQLVLRKGLPFDARIPNDDPIAALEEPAQNLRQFDSTREVFADLVISVTF